MFILLVETRVSWGIHLVQNVRVLMGINPLRWRGPKFVGSGLPPLATIPRARGLTAPDTIRRPRQPRERAGGFVHCPGTLRAASDQVKNGKVRWCGPALTANSIVERETPMSLSARSLMERNCLMANRSRRQVM